MTMLGLLPSFSWVEASPSFTLGSAIATSCSLLNPSEQQVAPVVGLLSLSATDGCDCSPLAHSNTSSLPDAAPKASSPPIAGMASISMLVLLSIWSLSWCKDSRFARQGTSQRAFHFRDPMLTRRGSPTIRSRLCSFENASQTGGGRWTHEFAYWRECDTLIIAIATLLPEGVR